MARRDKVSHLLLLFLLEILLVRIIVEELDDLFAVYYLPGAVRALRDVENPVHEEPACWKRTCREMGLKGTVVLGMPMELAKRIPAVT